MIFTSLIFKSGLTMRRFPRLISFHFSFVSFSEQTRIAFSPFKDLLRISALVSSDRNLMGPGLEGSLFNL